jgi:hypothetical protein
VCETRLENPWRASEAPREAPRGQHTSAYVSIREHTSSAYVSIRLGNPWRASEAPREAPVYCVSIRQHSSAYVSIRQHTSAYVSIGLHTSAYVSIRSVWQCCVCETRLENPLRASEAPREAPRGQHTSAYVSIRLGNPRRASEAPREAPVYSVSIRQHTSAYVSIRQHTSSAYGSIRWKPHAKHLLFGGGAEPLSSRHELESRTRQLRHRAASVFVLVKLYLHFLGGAEPSSGCHELDSTVIELRQYLYFCTVVRPYLHFLVAAEPFSGRHELDSFVIELRQYLY